MIKKSLSYGRSPDQPFRYLDCFYQEGSALYIWQAQLNGGIVLIEFHRDFHIVQSPNTKVSLASGLVASFSFELKIDP